MPGPSDHPASRSPETAAPKLRIERNGWASEDSPRPSLPPLSSLVAGLAKACARVESIEGAASSVLRALAADPRIRKAWVVVARGAAVATFDGTGAAAGADGPARVATSLEHVVEGAPRLLGPDAVARLGASGAAAAFGVAFPGGESWRGWLVAAGTWSPAERDGIEALVAAAAGFAWLAMARASAAERVRATAARAAVASAPEPAAAPVPGKDAPPAPVAAPAPVPGGPRTLLSAAALDGILAFVEATPGVKSPKLADGPPVYTSAPAREASRWIARILTAASEGKRALRLAVESAEGPCLRIETDGPLVARSGPVLAAIGDEIGARGGSLRIDQEGGQTRLLATFPKAA